MIFDTAYLKTIYPDYSNLSAKIANLIDHNFLVRLKQNLYTNNLNEHPFEVANKLYGPSYISFESALSYYQMIPEGVYVYTSATHKKRRSKFYENKIGRFSYQDIPSEVFQDGITTINGFRIAIKEKALCDMLYIIPQANSQKELLRLLIDYLRIDETELYSLNVITLRRLLPYYKSKNHKYFYALLERKNNGFVK